jgi:hypothetical protein
MICSFVYRDRFIRPSPSGPDSNSSWLIFRGARHLSLAAPGHCFPCGGDQVVQTLQGNHAEHDLDRHRVRRNARTRFGSPPDKIRGRSKLYHHMADVITLDEVERIVI